jgi:hypothetical protein
MYRRYCKTSLGSSSIAVDHDGLTWAAATVTRVDAAMMRATSCANALVSCDKFSKQINIFIINHITSFKG